MKNPGWANNRGSPPYISRNSSYQIPLSTNAPAAMILKAKAACGDEDGSLSILGLCSDFYVSKPVPTGLAKKEQNCLQELGLPDRFDEIRRDTKLTAAGGVTALPSRG